jgi:hypothetical protein
MPGWYAPCCNGGQALQSGYLPVLLAVQTCRLTSTVGSPLLHCRLEGGASSFRYLNQSDVYTLTDVDDAQEFRWVGGREGAGVCWLRQMLAASA